MKKYIIIIASALLLSCNENRDATGTGTDMTMADV